MNRRRPRALPPSLCATLASIVTTWAIARADDAAPRIEPIPPDPLTGTADVSPTVTGRDANAAMPGLIPPRSDSFADWQAGLEPLHYCGEPRALPPCVPPPPCHPAAPPHPTDLVGVDGVPTRGPIYRGPCQPRSGCREASHLSWLHRLPDRLFDAFYRSR